MKTAEDPKKMAEKATLEFKKALARGKASSAGIYILMGIVFAAFGLTTGDGFSITVALGVLFFCYGAFDLFNAWRVGKLPKDN